MGLFDKFKSSTAPAWDTQRAIMTIVAAAVKSDGEVSEPEIKRLRSMCVRSPVFASNSSSEDDEVIEFADTVTNQLGSAAIDQAAEALSVELRETALGYAIDIVLADGLLGRDEEVFIEDLVKRLGVSEDTARVLIQATLILNRPPQ